MLHVLVRLARVMGTAVMTRDVSRVLRVSEKINHHFNALSSSEKQCILLQNYELSQEA